MKTITDNRKLNTKERFIYRKEIETLLRTDFKDEKLRISKDLLEQLLFEEIVLNKEKNIVIKLPIWSGDFLKQIDLSEVDFSNVSWAALYYFEKNNEIFDEYELAGFYEKLKNDVNVSAELLNEDIEFYRERLKGEYKNYFVDYIMSIVPSGISVDKNTLLERIREISLVYRHTHLNIDYRNIDVPIDLSKAIEAIFDNTVCVINCNFNGSNVYMSRQPKNIYMQNSDFSNSKISLPEEVDDININECCFENCDLSNTKFDVTSMLSEGINLNNLKNSKAKICFRDIKGECFYMFKDKMLVGCYFDGNLIVEGFDMPMPNVPSL